MNATTRAILTTTAAAAFLATASASETKQAPEAKPQAEVGPYALQKKSAFTLAADRRAPFWPIGWVKRAHEGPVQITRQAPKPKLDENAFAVTSIMLGNPSLAVINARAYSEGEFIRMPKAGVSMKVRVQQIGDGAVSLNYENQLFTIALKRPELAAHKVEEDLLTQDR